MRRIAAVVLALALAACTPPRAEEKKEHLSVGERREVLQAFRDYVIASYDLLLVAQRATSLETDHVRKLLAEQKTRETEARDRLVAALEKGGIAATGAAADGLKGLVPLVRSVVARDGVYALLEVPGDPPSFQVVRVAKRRPGKIEIDGEAFAYDLVIHDETVVPDLVAHQWSRSSHPAPIVRLAVTRGKTIYLDRAAIERLGEQSFLPNVDRYREAVAAARTDAPFLAAGGDTKTLVALTKDVLRWRSLEPLWASISAFPKDEQVARFANDYEQREEVRAAIEARELEKARESDPATPTPDRLTAMEKKALLRAIAHGEPLGETANALGLAYQALRLEKGTVPPPLKAAAGVVADLVRDLAGKDATGTEAEARAFGRLARAAPDELRGLARRHLSR